MAMAELDNGGRFYNLYSRANNRIITKGELGKVGGIFNDKQRMILFLELSLSKLTPGMKAIVLARLDPEMELSYQKYKPLHLLASEAEKKGMIGTNTILTGTPKLVDSKSELQGFVMVPIMAGKAMTMVMVPIMDEYDVYEVQDELNKDMFFIAHTKNKVKLPECEVRVAGVLKALKPDKNNTAASKKFLEVSYFTEGGAGA